MSGSLFDIIGPVMVGPSSSHTAGAVRLGQLVRLLAGPHKITEIEFILYNSFAKTYRGHGTDRGLLAGVLGFTVDDDRIRDAMQIAEASGLRYKFTPFSGSNEHSPNTVEFKAVLEVATDPKSGSSKDSGKETLTVTGHSIGAGRIHISRINKYNVSLRGEYPTLILQYKDQPGMIWQVTKLIAEKGINIATLSCTRKQKGTEAFMTICLDSMLPPEVLDEITHIFDVYMVRMLDQIN